MRLIASLFNKEETMFSEQSKQEEKLVQDVATLVKKYDPDIAEVYYIPAELTGDGVSEIIVKNNLGEYRSYPFYVPRNRLIYDMTPAIINTIHAAKNASFQLIEKQTQYASQLLAILSELDASSETSIMTVRQKVDCQHMIDEMSDTLNHVLDTIGDKAARSNKKGFYVTDKLDAIEQIIISSDSPYRVLHKSPHCTIYGKSMPERNAHPVLVSSHADIVNNIKHPQSDLADGFYHGTYDNLGTNAAVVTLMLTNPDISDDVYFAFTDEEETGKCFGATESAKWLTGFTGNHPFCIALDVTDEGYYDNCLCSVEGLSATKAVCDNIKKAMFAVEPDNTQTFCVSKAKEKDNSPFPDDYISSQFTVFDESAHYAKLKNGTLSFCLPTNGYMHGDSGLDVKESVFIGYCLSLEAFLHSYCKDNIPLDNYVLVKEMLVEKAKETKRQRPTYPSYPYASEGSRIVEDDENEERTEASLGTIMDYFGIESPEDYTREELKLNFMLEDSLRGMADCYTPGEIEVFLQDVEYNYGRGMIDEDIAREIFKDVHENYNEEYDEEYEDYS